MTALTVPFVGRIYNATSLLKQLGSVMSSEMNPTILCNKLKTILQRELNLISVDFFLATDFEHLTMQSLGNKNEIDLKKEQLGKMIHTVKSPMIFTHLQNPLDKKLFQDLGISTIFPLSVGDEDLGLLVLGKKSGIASHYTKADIAFLQEFVDQASLAIRNASSYQKIQELNTSLEVKVIERTHELELSQAEQLRLKDEFVFIATHDLATPVTAISGFTALLLKQVDVLPANVKSNLIAISQASDRLKTLVTDLLQVARSDAGTIKLELVNVDAATVITSAVQLATPMANDKKVKINLSLGTDNQTLSDPKKLSEILENLLSNAIKYNKSGGSVTIKTYIEGSNLVIAVSDTGLGIPQNEQAKVFSKFFRSEDPIVRSIPGTGLGLFVVRMLTEKLGGKIRFESKPGEGTTFWLTFKR